MIKRFLNGFGLIEVLITISITSIGLLAIAGMQIKSIKATDNASKTSMAALLANDMANRMRVNNIESKKWESSAYLTSENSTPTCLLLANTCTSIELATRDLYDWNQAIGNLASGLKNGAGTITYTGASAYNITITWDDRDDTQQTFTTTLQP